MAKSHLRPHLVTSSWFDLQRYASPRRAFGQDLELPVRDRTAHSAHLKTRLRAAETKNAKLRGASAPTSAPVEIALEIRSEPGFNLSVDSLDTPTRGFRLASLHREANRDIAVVHVDAGKLAKFFTLVNSYETEDVRRSGKPKNKKLVESISNILLASLRSFWTDDPAKYPDGILSAWWEVWLREPGESFYKGFCELAKQAGAKIGPDVIYFPDRSVTTCFATKKQLSSSPELLDYLSELRRPKDNPRPILDLSPIDQAELVNSLRSRIAPPPAGAPAVCILDDGVARHPLLEDVLAEEDCLTVDANWALVSRKSHGTPMAGLVVFGENLPTYLEGREEFSAGFRIESVRLLPPPPKQNPPRLYGALTKRAASTAEINAADRSRVYCMAITESACDGTPSSWSGAVDQLCCGADDGVRRAVVISAGNADRSSYGAYPDSNATDRVQNPCQAWNAVSVGACTDLVTFCTETFPTHAPLAVQGDLSACSTTSLAWDDEWPYKPDIVMEGGNHAKCQQSGDITDPDELCLLSTGIDATGSTFLTTFSDTSASAALAARLMANASATYPTLWPETIRGLLIHSAEWTDAMKSQFLPNRTGATRRLRTYGYGRPVEQRLLSSRSNDATLISECEMQPFAKNHRGEITYNKVGVHGLPWPAKALRQLRDATVEVKVTLSYFVEPKPGRDLSFASQRYAYQSHGYRFEMQRPQETPKDFMARVNAAAERGADLSSGDPRKWEIGPRGRTHGSIHSDWFRGPATDIANSPVIAVFPIAGWWQTLKSKEYWKNSARYSLIVSIRASSTIDLYSEIESSIQLQAEQEVETEVELDSE